MPRGIEGSRAPSPIVSPRLDRQARLSPSARDAAGRAEAPGGAAPAGAAATGSREQRECGPAAEDEDPLHLFMTEWYNERPGYNGPMPLPDPPGKPARQPSDPPSGRSLLAEARRSDAPRVLDGSNGIDGYYEAGWVSKRGEGPLVRHVFRNSLLCRVTGPTGCFYAAAGGPAAAAAARIAYRLYSQAVSQLSAPALLARSRPPRAAPKAALGLAQVQMQVQVQVRMQLQVQAVAAVKPAG